MLKINCAILIFIILFVRSATFSLLPISSINPLIDPNELNEFVEYANGVYDILKEAALPESWEDVIAISVSESAAGFVGGALSIGVENILGDKKSDSLLTTEIVTGAYFSVRGLARGLAQVAGLPRPIASVLGNLAGSIASEGAKVAGRRAVQDALDKDVATAEAADKAAGSIGSSIGGGHDVDDLSKDSVQSESVDKGPLRVSGAGGVESSSRPVWMRSGRTDEQQISALTRKPALEPLHTHTASKELITATAGAANGKSGVFSVISAPEITLDVAKWVAYDLLVSRFDDVPLQDAALCGGLAGLASILLLEALKATGWKSFQGEFSFWAGADLKTRLYRAALEGAALFWAYEGSHKYLDKFLPSSISRFLEQDFAFYDVELIDPNLITNMK